MKKLIMIEILRKLKMNPHLMRKLKIFALVGSVGFIFTAGLLVWAGFAAVNYMASEFKQATQWSTVTQTATSSERQQRFKIQTLNCWDHAQSLLAIQPWLERPVGAHLADLKSACFDQKPIPCEGAHCEKVNSQVSAAEVSEI